MARIVDKKAKQKEILQAAMRVFARKGVANTKMIDVAREAGIGKGTIYEYFDSREQMLHMAFSYLLHRIKKLVVHRVDEAMDPREKIRTGFLAYLDVATMKIEDYADILMDFWAQSVRQRGSESDFFINLQHIYQDYRDLVVPALQEGMEQGLFRPMDPEKVASALIATCEGLLLQWLSNREGFDLLEHGKAAVQLFLDAFQSGLPSPAPDSSSMLVNPQQGSNLN